MALSEVSRPLLDLLPVLKLHRKHRRAILSQCTDSRSSSFLRIPINDGAGPLGDIQSTDRDLCAGFRAEGLSLQRHGEQYV